MNHRVKGKKLNFKITDLVGVLSFIHPLYLYLQGNFNYYFFIGISLGILFILFNCFGILGFYVKANKYGVVLYNEFIPQNINIKDIKDIEKTPNSILLHLNNNKSVCIDFDLIAKKQRYKTNDLYYDLHNIVQRSNTAKLKF